MTATPSLEHADDVVRALEALRARWSAQPTAAADSADQACWSKPTQLIAQLRELISTLDGQLAAMRWLAQKQYRPKSEHIPAGQLALDLLGFMLRPTVATADDSADSAGADVTPATKREPRPKRKSGLHLLPVKQVEKRLDEKDRICPCCGGARVGSQPPPQRAST